MQDEPKSLAGPAAGAEWAFIDQIMAAFPAPEGAVGIGDDAALWPWPKAGMGVATTDLLVEGTHFRRHTTSPLALGWKALAVNLSDLAAMGALPELALLTLALDPQEPEWGPGLMQGVKALAEATGTWLAGGDTVGVGAGGRMMVGFSLVGKAAQGKLLRNQARPGDLLIATGPFGAAAAGLWALEQPDEALALKAEAREALVRWHRQPWPRLSLGQCLSALAQAGHRIALLDDSDGLRRSAWLLAEASGVQVVLEAGRIQASWAEVAHPAAHAAEASMAHQAWDGAAKAQEAVPSAAAVAGTTSLAWALDGGEDYGLVAACSQATWEALKALPHAELGLPFRIVGRVEGGPVGVSLDEGGRRSPLAAAGGFAHL